MQLFHDEDQVQLWLGDARRMDPIPDGSAGLVLTCPPWWESGDYGHPDQIGFGQTYPDFLASLSEVWAQCYRCLMPGRAMIVWIADLLWREEPVALAADTHRGLQEAGFQYEATWYWFEPGKAVREEPADARVPLGCRPKVHAETILAYRKPGESEAPPPGVVEESVIPASAWQAGRQAVWTPGDNLEHPYRRLIRLWSYAGETVLDPFAGQGTIALSARALGRRSISVELNPDACRHITTLLSQPHMPFSASRRRR